jgi:hypothetical protein
MPSHAEVANGLVVAAPNQTNSSSPGKRLPLSARGRLRDFAAAEEKKFELTFNRHDLRAHRVNELADQSVLCRRRPTRLVEDPEKLFGSIVGPIPKPGDRVSNFSDIASESLDVMCHV